jgi:hypothetical protein
MLSKTNSKPSVKYYFLSGSESENSETKKDHKNKIKTSVKKVDILLN